MCSQQLPNRLPDDHVAQLWSMDYPAESPYGIAGARLVHAGLRGRQLKTKGGTVVGIPARFRDRGVAVRG